MCTSGTTSRSGGRDCSGVRGRTLLRAYKRDLGVQILGHRIKAGLGFRIWLNEIRSSLRVLGLRIKA